MRMFYADHNEHQFVIFLTRQEARIIADLGEPAGEVIREKIRLLSAIRDDDSNKAERLPAPYSGTEIRFHLPGEPMDPDFERAWNETGESETNDYAFTPPGAHDSDDSGGYGPDYYEVDDGTNQED